MKSRRAKGDNTSINIKSSIFSNNCNAAKKKDVGAASFVRFVLMVDGSKLFIAGIITA